MCLEQEGGTAAAALQEAVAEIAAAGKQPGTAEACVAGDAKRASPAMEAVRMAPQQVAGMLAGNSGALAVDPE